MQFKLNEKFAKELSALPLNSDNAPALRLENPAPAVRAPAPAPKAPRLT